MGKHLSDIIRLPQNSFPFLMLFAFLGLCFPLAKVCSCLLGSQFQPRKHAWLYGVCLDGGLAWISLIPNHPKSSTRHPWSGSVGQLQNRLQLSKPTPPTWTNSCTRHIIPVVIGSYASQLQDFLSIHDLFFACLRALWIRSQGSAVSELSLLKQQEMADRSRRTGSSDLPRSPRLLIGMG